MCTRSKGSNLLQGGFLSSTIHKYSTYSRVPDTKPQHASTTNGHRNSSSAHTTISLTKSKPTEHTSTTTQSVNRSTSDRCQPHSSTTTKRSCTDYPQVPPQCVMVQDPKDACCQVPYCDYVNPLTFTNGIPSPEPNPFLTPLPGQTPQSPQPITRPLPGFCVYKGVFYQQGQMWDEGCDKKCRCDEFSTGYYSCSERCQSYTNLPTNCRLITDLNDACWYLTLTHLLGLQLEHQIHPSITKELVILSQA